MNTLDYTIIALIHGVTLSGHFYILEMSPPPPSAPVVADCPEIHSPNPTQEDDLGLNFDLPEVNHLEEE